MKKGFSRRPQEHTVDATQTIIDRHRAKPPVKRAREATLRKAMIVCLRELPEEAVIDILTDNWTTLDRCDQLKARFP